MPKKDEFSWSSASLNLRTSVVRQMLASLTSKHSSGYQDALSAARAQLLMIEDKLAAPAVLPGPTGESNKLYLESRGIVVCLRDVDTSFDFWLMSVITALAAGNSVIALVDEKHMAQTQGCFKALQKTGVRQRIFQIASMSQTKVLLSHPQLAGVVIDSGCILKKWVGEQLAARDNAILPLITAQSNKGLFYRLVTEKTITIDTTAAGGNASLMTMTPED